jgi:protein-disulfide isomerase
LSEQPFSDAASAEDDGLTPLVPMSDLEEAIGPRRRPGWIAPAWFFFGILVGIVGFAAYNALVVKIPAAVPAQTESLDPDAMRVAARDGVLEAIATLQAGGPQQPAAQQPQGPQAVANNAFTVRAANRLGDPNAKITVVEFADYQCPFCKRYHDAVGPDLLKQYVDSGKIQFVYKHSAFLGQESVWAAQAAECAADQDQFWEYHDLLFAKQNGENVGLFTKDKLIAYAKELDLDIAKFEPCLQNDDTLQRVGADTEEGRQVGVTGTPTFFINGKPLVGAQPAEVFRAEIDAALGQ